MTSFGISKKFISDKQSFNFKNYLLFVGTLEPRKDIITLLKAYAHLKKEFRLKYKLIIAGHKGWGSLNLLDEVKILEIQESVIYLNSVDEEELGYLYQNAKCFISTSIYEGFGIPLLEAMMYGLPIIASKIEASEEVVGQAGMFFEPQNYKELCQLIKKILSEKKLFTKLSKLSFIQSKKFNSNEMLKKFEIILNN